MLPFGVSCQRCTIEKPAERAHFKLTPSSSQAAGQTRLAPACVDRMPALTEPTHAGRYKLAQCNQTYTKHVMQRPTHAQHSCGHQSWHSHQATDIKCHTLAVGFGAWLCRRQWYAGSETCYLQGNPSGAEALKETPAGTGCRGTGPPGAPISARLLGALGFGTEASADPGHWALGLVIPAGAGCRSTGPPGANSTERVW